MEHVFTESMFLVGFVIFIAAILVLDMLVIDRKAHVVSIKEAGSWTAVWIILALAFAVFIYFHGDMVHGIENFDDLKLIASRYASHLKLDPNDYEGSLQQYPGEPADERSTREDEDEAQYDGSQDTPVQYVLVIFLVHSE